MGLTNHNILRSRFWSVRWLASAVRKPGIIGRLLRIQLMIIIWLGFSGCVGEDNFEQIKTLVHPIILDHLKDSTNFTLANSPNLNNSISYHQLAFSNNEIKTLQSEFDKATIINIWAGKTLGIVYKTNRKSTFKRHQLKVNGFFYCSGDLSESIFYSRHSRSGNFTPIEKNWYRFEYSGTD